MRRTSLTMDSRASLLWRLALLIGTAIAQQQCYFGPGQEFRGPSELVPCDSTGASACCLLGDTCLSGNACYNDATGNTYQYGCTDVTYSDTSVCPYKCGFDPMKSPWTSLESCGSDQWVCLGPESCGCDWSGPTYGMLVLPRRSCQAMGNQAVLALSAPAQLAPYISLPSTLGGSTGYYSFFSTDGSSTWISTAVPGYTPDPITQLTVYSDQPTSTILISPDASPDSATYAAAHFLNGGTPQPAPTGESGGGNGGTQITDGPTFPVSSSSTTSTSGVSSSTSSPSTTTTTTTSAPATTTTSSSGGGGGKGGGLSTGAKAGIGVGVALGVVIILALVLAILWMRRRHRRDLNMVHQTPAPALDEPADFGKRHPDEKSPFMGGFKFDGKGTIDGIKKDGDEAVVPPGEPSELPASGDAEVHEMEAPPVELSAKPSVKGSPRPLSVEELSAKPSVRGSPRSPRHVNSVGSAFQEEGIS